jgi:dephospho-CoA kinase
MSRQTAPYIIKEAALLFESGSVAGLDFVIGVFSPANCSHKKGDGPRRHFAAGRAERECRGR